MEVFVYYYQSHVNRKHDTQLFLVLCCLLLLLFWWQGINAMMLYYDKLARKNVRFSSISSKILLKKKFKCKKKEKKEIYSMAV